MTANEKDPFPQGSPQPKRAWQLVLAALVLADMTASFESQMILAALKMLYVELRDPQGIAWLVSAYLIVAAITAALGARLGDIYGRKKVMVAILVIAGGGSAISAWSESLPVMIAGRALQGATGGIFPLCYGIARDHIPENRRAFAGGVLVTASALGALGGLVIGGWIVDQHHWRALFWLSAAFAAASALIAQVVVQRDNAQRGSGSLDVLGGALFAVGVTSLLLVIGNVRDWGLTDQRSVGLGIASLIALVWWVIHELRHDNPMIDVRMLTQRDLALTNLSVVMLGLGPFQLTLVMMLLLQQSPITGIGLGLSAAAAGVFKIPGNIASTVLTPVAGHFCQTVGERGIIMIGFALSAAAWAMLLAGLQSGPAILAAVIVCTVAGSVCFVGASNNVMRVAPAGRVSEAIGVATLGRTISSACGAQFLTLILGAAVLAKEPGSAVPIYMTAFTFMFATSVAGFLVASIIPNRKTRAS